MPQRNLEGQGGDDGGKWMHCGSPWRALALVFAQHPPLKLLVELLSVHPTTHPLGLLACPCCQMVGVPPILSLRCRVL